MKTLHLLQQLFFAAIPSLALAADASSSPRPEATPAPVKIVVSGQRPAPVYPKSMAEKGVTGKVMIEAIVDPAGKVSSAKVLESSDPAFSEAAVKAVLRWKFKSLQDDEPQASRKFKIPLSFAIASTPAAKSGPVSPAPIAASPASIVKQ